jgi:hypothetical protein
MTRKILVLLGGVLFATGCSTDTGKCTEVAQDKIYQSLSATYDSQSDKTTAMVTLRFSGPGGTTLELDGKCRLTHSNYSLVKQSFLGTYYRGEGTGFLPGHAFTFVNNDDASFSNSGTITAISTSAPVPTTISKASGVTITFAPAVAANDTVTAKVQSAANSSIASQNTSTVGATSVTISTAEFQLLSTGTATLWVERTSSTTPSQITSSGGSFSTTYVGPKSTATINP